MFSKVMQWFFEIPPQNWAYAGRPRCITYLRINRQMNQDRRFTVITAEPLRYIPKTAQPSPTLLRNCFWIFALAFGMMFADNAIAADPADKESSKSSSNASSASQATHSKSTNASNSKSAASQSATVKQQAAETSSSKSILSQKSDSDSQEAKKTPAPSPKDFEGLGFSVAPKEGGKTRTRFFGTSGEGYKFVYVIDRSGSMASPHRVIMRTVQAELAKSLATLDNVHQFQIIFYNERPTLMNAAGGVGRMTFATEQNKERALAFFDTVVADGGTDHEDALKLAIRLGPDVIFLLTDADDPKLTSHQLEKIRNMAAGITINTIQFGDGPQPQGGNFLIDLAQQNGGQHVYVDISKLSVLSLQK
jgi:hypothetical protein